MSLLVGLFCKTFQPDLPWLYCAVKSFERNWQDLCGMVVVAEPDCKAEIERWDISGLFKTIYVEPWPCGYCHAMATKLCADLYLPEADLILLFDSDMALTRPTSTGDLICLDGPTVIYDVWHSDIDTATRNVSRKVWTPAVKRSMGVELDRDWMVSPSWLYWASTFRGARSMIENHCRMPFWQAVYCTTPYDWQNFMDHPMKLCDMQALGIYAWENERNKYRFTQRTADVMDVPIVQGWSHAAQGPQV